VAKSQLLMLLLLLLPLLLQLLLLLTLLLELLPLLPLLLLKLLLQQSTNLCFSSKDKKADASRLFYVPHLFK